MFGCLNSYILDFKKKLEHYRVYAYIVIVWTEQQKNAPQFRMDGHKPTMEQ